MEIKNLQGGLVVGLLDNRLFSVERDTELSFVEKWISDSLGYHPCSEGWLFVVPDHSIRFLLEPL